MASAKSTAVAPAKDNAPAPQTALTRSKGLISRMAARFEIDPDKLTHALKQTAFRQRKPKGGGDIVPVTDEQMLMLMVVAEQYHLNPFTKEIYAYPSEGGITAVVSIDGWIRIINEHPQFAWMTIDVAPPGTPFDEAWATCVIKRKDRDKPTEITEYLVECKRDTDPWNNMPRRMLRHKAVIQCARVAFGFAGIHDPDEAERIFAAAIDVTPRDAGGKPIGDEPRRKSAGPAPAAIDPPASAAGDTSEARITLDQLTMLKDKLNEEGVAESLFLAEFEIGALEELPAAEFVEAIKAIDETSSQQTPQK